MLEPCTFDGRHIAHDTLPPSASRYKAYFRWNHYAFKLRNGASHLPTETDACASVTAAFLQVGAWGAGRHCLVHRMPPAAAGSAQAAHPPLLLNSPLQVLHTLHIAEQNRVGEPRNILQVRACSGAGFARNPLQQRSPDSGLWPVPPPAPSQH